MQAGPKKRTSVNGRAALKLMWLDGARRADQAASDARVTRAGSSIAVALLASRDPPGPRRQPAPCTASPAAAAHRDRHTEGGLDRADPGADEQAASDGRAPAVFARAAAIACQADEAVEVVHRLESTIRYDHRRRLPGPLQQVPGAARPALVPANGPWVIRVMIDMESRRVPAGRWRHFDPRSHRGRQFLR
jgi:hypothetical protein